MTQRNQDALNDMIWDCPSLPASEGAVLGNIATGGHDSAHFGGNQFVPQPPQFG